MSEANKEIKQNRIYIFIDASKNNISEELRTGSNGYIDILNIPEIWGVNIIKGRLMAKIKPPAVKKVVLGCNNLLV